MKRLSARKRGCLSRSKFLNQSPVQCTTLYAAFFMLCFSRRDPRECRNDPFRSPPTPPAPVSPAAPYRHHLSPRDEALLRTPVIRLLVGENRVASKLYYLIKRNDFQASSCSILFRYLVPNNIKWNRSKGACFLRHTVEKELKEISRNRFHGRLRKAIFSNLSRTGRME